MEWFSGLDSESIYIESYIIKAQGRSWLAFSRKEWELSWTAFWGKNSGILHIHLSCIAKFRIKQLNYNKKKILWDFPLVASLFLNINQFRINPCNFFSPGNFHFFPNKVFLHAHACGRPWRCFFWPFFIAKSCKGWKEIQRKNSDHLHLKFKISDKKREKSRGETSWIIYMSQSRNYSPFMLNMIYSKSDHEARIFVAEVHYVCSSKTYFF